MLSEPFLDHKPARPCGMQPDRSGHVADSTGTGTISREQIIRHAALKINQQARIEIRITRLVPQRSVWVTQLLPISENWITPRTQPVTTGHSGHGWEDTSKMITRLTLATNCHIVPAAWMIAHGACNSIQLGLIVGCCWPSSTDAESTLGPNNTRMGQELRCAGPGQAVCYYIVCALFVNNIKLELLQP